ncbi:hypothetical protein P153DRAFT_300326 [Dothidotthia symphoricarpi CBS 119687]|uniref:Uncharacterized protein n=1 Tax=Dothidotthia symphoricarpi CBS 119687 TaxID=1392245 RepID=A0A6A6A2I3_9PLEO|nr:uncharacterized protein P153DRAFT_300326 [Dothidotthia symphoricarpi CBS 119687]KAF2125393.1 hypothetical protein P153DRAFT_300326 [Dothidotthia symphoricarpi CBS 119687]
MQAAMMQPQQASAYGAMPVRRKPIANPGVSMRPPSQPYLDAPLGHSRTRTVSSGVFPAVSASPTATMMHQQYPSQYPSQYQGSLRRTPTSSTSSTTGTPNRSNSGALRRSSSARSGTSPTSYVALMRKQKATVWCDRAQYEDPRIVAAQQQAKMRANMEVAGGPHHAPPRSASGGSSMAAGVRSKVRHHGMAKASKYAPVTYTGSGVPMRLSASEVDEGDEEDGGSIHQGGAHHRTGSGRSSLGSNRRISYANPVGGRLSTNSSPPQNTTPDELDDVQEEPTPNPDEEPAAYFERSKTNLSFGSGSEGERGFGDVGQMKPLPKLEVKKSTVDDLIRRGSVDERKATMSSGRLFIANPDLSD